MKRVEAIVVSSPFHHSNDDNACNKGDKHAQNTYYYDCGSVVGVAIIVPSARRLWTSSVRSRSLGAENVV